MASTTTSQLSSFASIHRNLNLHHRRSISTVRFPTKLSIVMSVEGHDAETSSSKNLPNLKYAANLSTSSVEQKSKANPELQDHVNGKIGVNGPLNSTITEKKGAKIHDFCFGIPFGGFVLAGGLLGSIFSRNLATLGSGVLFGGAILALSTISLKVWREGKTCIPFTLGQAVLAAALLWKNYQAYSLTNKLFPSGLYALLSGAMLLFYTYVVISGGNPPPKKSKYAASTAS